MERILGEIQNQKIRVLVVWEPILPTDWRSPTTSTLARISDSRAAQFWDAHHLVAQELRRDLSAEGVPLAGHTSRGFYWDLAVLYPQNARWNGTLPTPSLIDGPVVEVQSQLEAKLRLTAAQ